MRFERQAGFAHESRAKHSVSKTPETMSGGCPQPGICASAKTGCCELIPPTLAVGRPMITLAIGFDAPHTST